MRPGGSRRAKGGIVVGLPAAGSRMNEPTGLGHIPLPSLLLPHVVKG